MVMLLAPIEHRHDIRLYRPNHMSHFRALRCYALRFALMLLLGVYKGCCLNCHATYSDELQLRLLGFFWGLPVSLES